MDGQKEYDNIDDELNAVLEQSFAKANLKRPLPPPLAAESAQLSSAPQSDRPPKNAAAAKPNNVVPYPGPTYREERNGDRLLPVSDVGERGLLCALLLSPAETAKLCANRIAPRMFMHPAYARLYELVFEWTEAGQEVNLNWLVERIGGMKLLEELGGRAGLAELYAFEGRGNAEFNIDLVLEAYRRRQLIVQFGALKNRCYDRNDDLPQIIGIAQKAITEIYVSGCEPEQK